MYGTVSEDREVDVPASEAWKLYGTLELSKITGEALKTSISKVEVVEGDGSVGTILQSFFVPGFPGMTSSKEKFTVVDNEKRVKVAEVIEGGFLEVGFTLYRVRYEIIEKEGVANKCILKSTIEYEVNDEAAAKTAFASFEPVCALMDFAAQHLVKNFRCNLDSCGFPMTYYSMSN